MRSVTISRFIPLTVSRVSSRVSSSSNDVGESDEDVIDRRALDGWTTKRLDAMGAVEKVGVNARTNGASHVDGRRRRARAPIASERARSRGRESRARRRTRRARLTSTEARERKGRRDDVDDAPRVHDVGDARDARDDGVSVENLDGIVVRVRARVRVRDGADGRRGKGCGFRGDGVRGDGRRRRRRRSRPPTPR